MPVVDRRPLEIELFCQVVVERVADELPPVGFGERRVRIAIDCGADWVLVVGRIPAIYPEKCFIEPTSLVELSKIPSNMRVVWNSRDLNTGGLKAETFEQARANFPGWLCQASNIQRVTDLKEGADAVLVGAHLEEFISSL